MLNRLSGSLALISILSCMIFFSACGSSNSANSTTSTDSLAVSATLPPAVVGSAYSGAVTVSGGTAPYSFSTASGELPQGVTLNAGTGAISGTPTASGNFGFVAQVTDSKGLSKQQSLQITVSNVPVTNASVAVNPDTATVTSGATQQFTAQVSNASNTAVNWKASQGTISGAGLYSAPQVSASTTVQISATSVADASASASASVTVNPATNQVNSSASGNSFSSVQRSGGWAEYAQTGPDYVDCSPSPCDGITFSMNQGVSSPSISGNATEYNLGGGTPFTDALFNNHLIGPSSSQGMPDSNQSIIPTLHNFTYDVYFYGSDLGLAQALEFDINQFFGNTGLIFGHECRIASGNEWDVWDDQSAQWIPTGIPCYPNSNAWNHLTLKVQRGSNNQVTYQSITLNGVTNTLNWTYYPGSTPGWYGLTINFQMDGNNREDPYSVYLDNLTFTYQ